MWRGDDGFGEVIPGGKRVHGLAFTANQFEIEIDGVADRVRGSNIKIFDIEEAAQLFPDFDEEIFLVESGAEGAPKFVEDVEFLGAARGLLDEVAIFDGHADLVAEGEKKAEFGGSEAAIVGSAEEKEAEGLFLGLETDDDDAAEAVLEGEFAEAAKRLVVFKRGEVVVAQIPETGEAAEAGDQPHETTVPPLFLARLSKHL